MPVMTSCLGCGCVIPKGTPYSRCDKCVTPVIHRKRVAHDVKYAVPGVKGAMREAIARAGNRCVSCGVPNTAENPLQAHLPGGGPHPADWRAYVVLCRNVCHPKVEKAERAS